MGCENRGFLVIAKKISFTKITKEGLFPSHFTGKKTEAQRGRVILPRAQSKLVSESGTRTMAFEL